MIDNLVLKINKENKINNDFIFDRIDIKFIIR